MNIRTWGALGALGVGVVVGALVLGPDEADADITVVVRSSTAVLTHGDFQVLPDAGLRLTLCGHALMSDGGTVLHVGDGSPCETFEPGSNPLSTFLSGGGLTRWKNRRGL